MNNENNGNEKNNKAPGVFKRTFGTKAGWRSIGIGALRLGATAMVTVGALILSEKVRSS